MVEGWGGGWLKWGGAEKVATQMKVEKERKRYFIVTGHFRALVVTAITNTLEKCPTVN